MKLFWIISHFETKYESLNDPRFKSVGDVFQGHVFLDTMDPSEYYAQALNGHRPAPIKVITSAPSKHLVSVDQSLHTLVLYCKYCIDLLSLVVQEIDFYHSGVLFWKKGKYVDQFDLDVILAPICSVYDYSL